MGQCEKLVARSINITTSRDDGCNADVCCSQMSEQKSKIIFVKCNQHFADSIMQTLYLYA